MLLVHGRLISRQEDDDKEVCQRKNNFNPWQPERKDRGTNRARMHPSGSHPRALPLIIPCFLAHVALLSLVDGYFTPYPFTFQTHETFRSNVYLKSTQRYPSKIVHQKLQRKRPLELIKVLYSGIKASLATVGPQVRSIPVANKLQIAHVYVGHCHSCATVCLQ